MYKEIRLYECKCENPACKGESGGHIWFTRAQKIPRRCPKCGVSTWNKASNDVQDKDDLNRRVGQ